MLPLKRKKPSETILEKRKEFISNICMDALEIKGKGEVGLENGNNKTGSTGGVFDIVYVWNMPAIITCPGASQVCKSYCYNASYASNGMAINNYILYKKDIKKLEQVIVKQLDAVNNNNNNIGLRWHSSGDFFSVEYIQMWNRIVRSFSNVCFWGYTRSWCIDELRKELNILENNVNVNLYYSWDISMKKIKDNHKISVVDINLDRSVKCPEQYGLVCSCADCGICFYNKKESIYFEIH